MPETNIQPVVAYCATPTFGSLPDAHPTAAKAAGLRYEAAAIRFAQQWANENNYTMKAKPWIRYRNRFGSFSYCQPDTLLLSNDNDNLIVVEYKLRHTRDALTQLRKYKHMMQELHPEYHINLTEVCRYFDCAEVRIPVLDRFAPHPHSVAAYIWQPSTPLLAYDA